MPIDWELDKYSVDQLIFKGYEYGYKKSAVSGEDRLYYDRTKPIEKSMFYAGYMIETKRRTDRLVEPGQSVAKLDPVIGQGMRGSPRALALVPVQILFQMKPICLPRFKRGWKQGLAPVFSSTKRNFYLMNKSGNWPELLTI